MKNDKLNYAGSEILEVLSIALDRTIQPNGRPVRSLKKLRETKFWRDSFYTQNLIDGEITDKVKKICKKVVPKKSSLGK